MAEPKKIDKGGQAEEALRRYFKQLGAFVIRGVPVREGRDTITDIDLWTYTRASIHARHIAIVDIKNKKRAKGYERVIWFKGLQSAVKADEAIVASTSSRENLGPFAARIGVRQLSSQVFKAVLSRYENADDRHSSEEMEEGWKRTFAGDARNVKARVDSCLEEISLGISFAALNTWIDEASHFLVHSVDHEREPGPVCRAMLFCASLVAVGADFLGKDLAFSDAEERRVYFRQGLMFGRPEKDASERYVRFAERMVTDFLGRSGAAASRIRTGFKRSVEELPIAHFVEFFARPAAGKELVDAAIQLEHAAFSKATPRLSELPPEARTILALISDYAEVPRRRVLGVGSTSGNTNRGETNSLLL